MPERYFAPGQIRDIAADFAAMSRIAHDLHGQTIAPNPQSGNPLHDALTQLSGATLGEELTHGCAFLAAALDSGAFDMLMHGKGTITGKVQPYKIIACDLRKLDPHCNHLSFMQYRKGNPWFGIDMMHLSQDICPVQVIERRVRKKKVELILQDQHLSLISFIWKVIVQQVGPRGAVFVDVLDDFDGMFADASAAYGPPAQLSENHYVFESPNLFIDTYFNAGWEVQYSIIDTNVAFRLPTAVQAHSIIKFENINDFENMVD